MFGKENINNCRVLTMSNNRKCDYLSIDVGIKDNVTLMGIKEMDNTVDVVFVKNIHNKTSEDIVEIIGNICHEFNINTILIDKNGVGNILYSCLSKSLKYMSIIGIPKINDNAILNLKKDINICGIRFLQTYECALKSYKKPFLGFSEVMGIHKETDMLVEEIDNIDLIIKNERVRSIGKNKKIGKSRLNCLLTYYTYKNSNKNNCEKKEFRRMADYNILEGTLYKYMFKAVDTGNLKIIFYCNSEWKMESIKEIIKEKNFKDVFNNEIIRIALRGGGASEICLQNGSNISFKYADDNARGYKFHYAVVDTNIPKRVYKSIILPSCYNYYFEEELLGIMEEEYRINFI